MQQMKSGSLAGSIGLTDSRGSIFMAGACNDKMLDTFSLG